MLQAVASGIIMEATSVLRCPISCDMVAGGLVWLGILKQPKRGKRGLELCGGLIAEVGK